MASLQTRLSALITAIGADVKALQSEWGAWTAVTFLGNWGNFGGSEQVCQYRVSSKGFVQLRGTAKYTGTFTPGGTKPIFAMPSGARPAAAQNMAGYASDAGAGGIGPTSVLYIVGGATPWNFLLWSELTGRAAVWASGTVAVLPSGFTLN